LVLRSTVDSSYKSPELTLISPKKITYTTSEVELIFSTTKELKSAKYILDYHLDSRARYIFINGNITLTNLASGTHKIIFFADCSDKYHHGNSLYQGTSFNVSINTNTTKAQNTTKTENNTTAQNLTIDYNLVFLTTAAVAVIIAVVCLSLYVYSKKRKSEAKPS